MSTNTALLIGYIAGVGTCVFLYALLQSVVMWAADTAHHEEPDRWERGL